MHIIRDGVLRGMLRARERGRVRNLPAEFTDPLQLLSSLPALEQGARRPCTLPQSSLRVEAGALVVGFPAELLLVIMIEKLTRFDYSTAPYCNVRVRNGVGDHHPDSKGVPSAMAVSVSWYDSRPLCRCLYCTPEARTKRGKRITRKRNALQASSTLGSDESDDRIFFFRSRRSLTIWSPRCASCAWTSPRMS